ncbi:putative holin-like toxin [Pontibacillus marinus]|nr:putative holin-like toxin [Pontibacillus marinus]
MMLFSAGMFLVGLLGFVVKLIIELTKDQNK